MPSKDQGTWMQLPLPCHNENSQPFAQTQYYISRFLLWKTATTWIIRPNGLFWAKVWSLSLNKYQANPKYRTSRAQGLSGRRILCPALIDRSAYGKWQYSFKQPFLSARETSCLPRLIPTQILFSGPLRDFTQFLVTGTVFWHCTESSVRDVGPGLALCWEET